MCQFARYNMPALVGAGSKGQLKEPVNVRRGMKSKKLNLKVKTRPSLLLRMMSSRAHLNLHSHTQLVTG